jgi:lipopolysaccharide/colanic/teichoic acid biosynthesis glycosyltransferase
VTGAPRVAATAVAEPQRGAVRRHAKRLLDIAVASLALIVLAPVLTLIAIALRAESQGPVLFRQQRVGRDGRPFEMWKFRTMVADAERLRASLVAMSRDPDWLDLEDDPRVTRVGRRLRRMSLDELPQLVNVLRGQMSLVGPRPLIPVDHDRVPAWAARRDEVRPGITGLWQVSGRADLPFLEMLRLDCRYLETWSLGRDLLILLRTIPAVITARGAD